MEERKAKDCRRLGFYDIDASEIEICLDLASRRTMRKPCADPPEGCEDLVKALQERMCHFTVPSKEERDAAIAECICRHFIAWLETRPLELCDTRQSTLWALYRLASDIHWYIDCQLWERTDVDHTRLLQRFAQTNDACERFGYSPTVFPATLKAIIRKDGAYLIEHQKDIYDEVTSIFLRIDRQTDPTEGRSDVSEDTIAHMDRLLATHASTILTTIQGMGATVSETRQDVQEIAKDTAAIRTSIKCRHAAETGTVTEVAELLMKMALGEYEIDSTDDLTKVRATLSGACTKGSVKSAGKGKKRRVHIASAMQWWADVLRKRCNRADNRSRDKEQRTARSTPQDNRYAKSIAEADRLNPSRNHSGNVNR